MKSIMYHYVREGSSEYPYFRYLHIEDFRAQLDYFQKEYKLLTRDEFLSSIQNKEPVKNGVVLTFDDGLCDHFTVTKELVSRGLWGVFYIPTGGYKYKTLLNVHRLHVLLGKFGGVKILEALRAVVSDAMIFDQDVQRFHDVTYKSQENDDATTLVKKIMNYSVQDKFKNDVLKSLMDVFFENERELASQYYLTNSQIKFMHDAGMLIGGHSVTHPVFSKLSYEKQKNEIVENFQYIENITGRLDCKTFCYPYGGNHVFNQDTLTILRNENLDFTFSVEQRNIEKDDLLSRIQALPRYDCNQFPFGQAAMGTRKPSAIL